MQVFVLGMHRSGTSAMARVLNLMGLYFGGEEVGIGRSAENKKGFWERRDVRALNDAMLFAAGCDWDCLSSLDVDALPAHERGRYTALAGDIVLKLDAHRPWFVKEPRLSALFPVWRAALETPVCVHVFRSPHEVASSLQERNGIPVHVGLALWEAYNVRALVGAADVPRLFTSFEDLLRRPAETARAIHAALQTLGDYPLRRPTEAELTRFLDPLAHHQRHNEEELQGIASAGQLAVYNLLQDAAASASDVPLEAPALSTKSRLALAEYEATVDLDLRRADAEVGTVLRSDLGLALQVALKNHDLSHANTRIKEAQGRSRTLERKAQELQVAVGNYQAELAQAKERAHGFERTARDRQAELAQTQAELAQTKERAHGFERTVRDRQAELAQANERARGLERTARDRQAELAQANERAHGLEMAVRDVERQRDALADRNAKMRGSIRNAAVAGAAQRKRILAAVRLWDVELGLRRSKIAELRQFAALLEEHIRALLASKRWRLGNALVSFATLSPGQRDALQRMLARANEARRSRCEAIEAMANGLVDAPAVLAHDIVGENALSSTLVGSDAKRDVKLLRMPLERRLKVSERLAEGTALARHVVALVEIAETLRDSKRWRVGNGILGLPGRLALRPPRPTALHSLAGLLEQHRSGEFDVDLQGALLETTQSPKLDTCGDEKQSTEPKPAQDRSAARVENTSEARRSRRPAVSALAPSEDFGSARPLYQAKDLWRRAQVDIVVCVHNALEHVERCIESVLARTTVDFRLIVVNDGSGQPTSERLRELAERHAEIELLETTPQRVQPAGAPGPPAQQVQPLGYTCAANHGLRHSSADYVVLLNSDTIVPRLWLEGLLDAMSSRENMGLVGPLSNAASWQSVPERSDADGWKVNELPAGYNVDDFAELVHSLSARRFPRVEFLNGFCLMLRRSVIERVGLLDEARFPQGYGEEDDYCLRVRRAGFELAVADHCYVYHAKSKSFGVRREQLAQAGGEALAAKHGTAAIAAGTEQVRNSVDLAHIRKTIDDFLHGDETQRAKPDAKTCDVLFLLPVKGASGGANSVVQEAAGMRALGVDARVATPKRHADSFKRFYRRLFDAGDAFVFYDSDEDLYAKARHFDVVVATLWSTPALIAPFALRHPEKLYVYYVQDYEPHFFPNDPESQAAARKSYTLVPNMVLMAKTDWICRTILDKHCRHVHRVVPSLDRSVYHARGAGGQDGGSVTVAAMVRPSTSRRAPLRTLRVLKAVTKTARANVRVEIFGCKGADLESYIARNAAAIGGGFAFRNHGVLPSDDVAELLRRADVFIDVSDYQAFGRTGLEAMACGCAVLLPAEGGVHEYAVHGDNAIVVDARSFATVVVELTKLVDDDELRARLSRRGIETARRYSIVGASLSELGVFRQAWAAKLAGREAKAAAFGRGLAPIKGETADEDAAWRTRSAVA